MLKAVDISFLMHGGGDASLSWTILKAMQLINVIIFLSFYVKSRQYITIRSVPTGSFTEKIIIADSAVALHKNKTV